MPKSRQEYQGGSVPLVGNPSPIAPYGLAMPGEFTMNISTGSIKDLRIQLTVTVDPILEIQLIH